jgi:4-amino-4-deoxy-L-arabinose transferase-like glycosyltransferase
MSAVTTNQVSQSCTSPSSIEWLIIISILLLATALRFTALEQALPALNVDEALNGYEAYSLLKTGRDQWGNPWPVTIRGFNDYRRPAIVYTAIPFVATFGLTIYAIRATAAMWGVLGVLFTYRLARDMFGQWAGVLAGLMLTISPWHLHFSRIGLEATVAMLTVVMGVWCLWRWFRNRRLAWLIGAGLGFGLSLYTYTPAQAFIPLMVAACGLIFARQLWHQKRAVALTVVVFALVAVPLVYTLVVTSQNQNRLDYVFLIRPGESLTQSLSTTFHQWLGHFSPRYLFIRGDAHKVLHPPISGQLHAIDAILLPLGVLNLFKTERSQRAGMLLIAWVALGAVPAALTIQEVGTPHSLRGMLGVPAFAIIAAQGVMKVGIAHRLGPRLRAVLLGVLIGVLAWNASTFLQRYFVVYPVRAARAFEYGTKEAMAYVLEHKDEYDTIVLTDWISQPHIFALFFERYDPHQFQASRPEYAQTLSAKLAQWDKYRVGDVDELYTQLEHGLFVARPHQLSEAEPVLTIYHPNGSPAFKIISK